MTDLEIAERMAAQAQRWHETDHGPSRGKKKKRPHVTAREDDFDPDTVPDSFRECQLCRPSEPDGALGQHVNPFWYRVVAWESDQKSGT